MGQNGSADPLPSHAIGAVDAELPRCGLPSGPTRWRSVGTNSVSSPTSEFRVGYPNAATAGGRSVEPYDSRLGF